MELKARLQRVLQILEESEGVGTLSAVERDIVLSDLREAYAEVKFAQTDNEVQVAEPAAEPVTEQVAEPVAPVAPITEEAVEAEDNEPEVEVELIFDEEDDEEPVTEQVEEQVAELPTTPTTSTAPTEASAMPLPAAPKRSALLSLYEDEPTPVLGEQFHEAPSVAESIACPRGVADGTPIVSLRSAIGVADRYMLVRELFDGDTDGYEEAIDALEAQRSFDDCVIYIAEHYVWRPQSEGTRYIMSLLQRKYESR